MKSLLSFLGGVVVGAAGGIAVYNYTLRKRLDTYYAQLENQMMDEFEHMEAQFMEDMAKVYAPEDYEEEEPPKPVEGNINLHQDTSNAEYVRYHEMYTQKGQMEEPDDEEMSESEQADFEAFENHRQNNGRQPKIITNEKFSNLDSHIDKQVLIYHALNDCLCDENDQPIDNPEYFVGACLDQYAFRTSEETLIFVMNYRLDTAYEVQKINDEYTGD